jgi:hypothetical protein
MRSLVPVALALLLVPAFALGGLAGRAHGEDPAPAPAPVDNETLFRHIQALQRQVIYLRAREARTTAYVLKNAERADALKKLTADLRAAGFAMAANPAPARERLLAGLDAFAEELKKDLPAVTSEEAVLIEGAR